MSSTTRHLSVRKTARLVELGSSVAQPEECWIVVHGYRQLAPRFIRRFASLDDGRRRIVAPEGLHRFYIDEDGGPHGSEHRVGASWMTREDRAADIADYIGYLDEVAALLDREVGREAPRIVLGFSQGVHTVARWIVSGAAPTPHTVVLWGAPLPDDLDEERASRRLGGTRLVRVHGATDSHHGAAARAGDAERLAGWGLSAQVLEHPGGHRIDPDFLGGLSTLSG